MNGTCDATRTSETHAQDQAEVRVDDYNRLHSAAPGNFRSSDVCSSVHAWFKKLFERAFAIGRKAGKGWQLPPNHPNPLYQLMDAAEGRGADAA
eukprot:1152549-Pelagomonas_calceolata.AAC.7